MFAGRGLDDRPDAADAVSQYFAEVAARLTALEAAADNVTINAVLPGNVDTKGARAEAGSEYFELMRPSIPVARFGLPRASDGRSGCWPQPRPASSRVPGSLSTAASLYPKADSPPGG